MNYKLAICDDNPADIQYLSALVSQWADIHQIHLQLDGHISSEPEPIQ